MRGPPLQFAEKGLASYQRPREEVKIREIVVSEGGQEEFRRIMCMIRISESLCVVFGVTYISRSRLKSRGSAFLAFLAAICIVYTFFITDPDLARICVRTIIAGFYSPICKYCSGNLDVLCI